MQIDAIDATKTAMIVVDMQNDFVAAGAPWKHLPHGPWYLSLSKP